ncbi:MAG TPA: alginate lyase family protein [Terracidiphilus sp.]|nr:alginate lyase family protein [Terracidiphilus sp.]
MRSIVLAILIGVPTITSLPALAAAPSTPPATLAIDGAFLAQAKTHPDAAILEAVRAEADKAMGEGPFSVMDKKDVPPSGDKHDYMSLAPYWWPSPATKDGLPYIRHDGEVNPERYKVPDDAAFNKMQNAVHALALGYYFTGKEEYAARAALLLRTWFLDAATRMNPNLNYAQAVLGVNNGRGIGLIDVRTMPRVLDGITLLEGSPSLTKDDREGLRKWFAQYLDWLKNSKNGRDESDSKNNHGSWYDQQITGIALFLGDETLAHDVAETAKTKRIAFQIQPDGSEPLELARTKSFSYSVFNLDALEELAQEDRLTGVDLWSYKAQNGASIRAALDYLLPYAKGEEKWTHAALNGVDASSLTEPLLLAALHYRDASYLEDAKKFEKSPNAETMLLQARVEEALKTH